MENFIHQGNKTRHAEGSCGVNKCFFRLSSDHNIGYLVSLRTEGETDGMVQQWERGQYLKSMYGMEHLMLAPPQLTMIKTQAFADYLSTHNSKAICGNTKDGNCIGPKHANVYNITTLIRIQKVRVLPEPYALFGCSKAKRQYQHRAWGNFVRSVDQESFAPRFRTAVQYLQTTLETELQKGTLVCLYDFQAMVGNDGVVYLVDIDLHPPKNKTHRVSRKDERFLKDCRVAFQQVLTITTKNEMRPRLS